MGYVLLMHIAHHAYAETKQRIASLIDAGHSSTGWGRARNEYPEAKS